ncbi:hypothetical protein A9K71_23110 [Mesorhizobium sp. WSM3873]|nr:hypothetical protein A9K71_23110 [Mesorhizobium sp. WSM3873]
MTMLYRSTDRLCRRGAAMENLAHSASFDSEDKDAPSKPGIKHLGERARVDRQLGPVEDLARLLVAVALAEIKHFPALAGPPAEASQGAEGSVLQDLVPFFAR